MKLQHEPRAHPLIVRRSRSESQDSANRGKFEGRGTGGFFLVQPRQSEGHAVGRGTTCPALLRERIGERVVCTRPREPRPSREKGIEGRAMAGDRLIESAAKRAGSRLEHAAVP